MMWAITIVQNESAIPSWLKISSAEIPATISGTTSGTSISTFAPGPSGPARATRPIASAVPITVAATIVSERDLERGEQRLAQGRVVEELLVPLQREALEGVQRLDRVEREQDDDQDRQEQEDVDADREDAQEARPVETVGLAHIGGAPRRHARPSAGSRSSRSRGRSSSPRSAPRRTASCWRRRTGPGSGCRPCRCRARRAAGRRRSRRPRAGRRAPRRRGSPAWSAAG